MNKLVTIDRCDLGVQSDDITMVVVCRWWFEHRKITVSTCQKKPCAIMQVCLASRSQSARGETKLSPKENEFGAFRK